MSTSASTETGKFDGVNPPCHNFLARIQIHFGAEASRYPDDKSKVMYLFSQLSGRAFDWAVAAIKEKKALLEDYDLAAELLEATFERPDRRRMAGQQLRQLVQGGDSVEVYAEKFRDLATWAEWNEWALVDQFVGGLNESIQDQLAALEQPTRLFDNFLLASRLDQRITARQKNKARAHPAPAEGASSQPTQAIRSNVSNSNSKEKPQPNDGTCFYCKKFGHSIAQCKKKAEKEALKGPSQSSNH